MPWLSTMPRLRAEQGLRMETASTVLVMQVPAEAPSSAFEASHLAWVLELSEASDYRPRTLTMNTYGVHRS